MTVSPSTASIVPLPVIRLTTTPLRSIVVVTGISRLNASLLVLMVLRRLIRKLRRMISRQFKKLRRLMRKLKRVMTGTRCQALYLMGSQKHSPLKNTVMFCC